MMGVDLEERFAALSRMDLRHPWMGRLEQLVWERVTINEEHAQQRRVRSSVLVFTIAAAFVSGIIIGGRGTDHQPRTLVAEDAELLLPSAIE